MNISYLLDSTCQENLWQYKKTDLIIIIMKTSLSVGTKSKILPRTPQSTNSWEQVFRVQEKLRILMKIMTWTNLVSTLEIINHVVRNGSDSLQCSTFYHETWLGTLRPSLGADFLAAGLCLCLQLIILFLPQAELLSASWRYYMLHSDMDPLPYDPISYLNAVADSKY